MRKPVILSAVRTVGGKFGGSLSKITADDLAAAVIREAVKRSGIDAEDVDELIFGCGWQAGIGPNVARLGSIKAGLPVKVPASTVNIRCASSLQAIIQGARAIRCGDADTVVVGGTESASNVPYIVDEARWGVRMGDTKMYDVLHKDGFMCPLAGMLMGNTAELLAEKYSISRLEQDLFAIESHRKALEAVRLGRFKNETLPIHVTDKKRELTVTEEDIPRPDVSLEALERLPAIFKKEGTVTAGNSCALCDSAAALVLMAEDKAKQNGLKPIGSIVSYGAAGVEPKYMGIGPVQAIPIALRLAGLELHQIDLIELNEAFAVQYLAVEKELQLNRDKVNVHGGAIALGHPVGATGAKLMTTLLHALQSHQKKTGLVSACVGGGQGLSIIVENAN